MSYHKNFGVWQLAKSAAKTWWDFQKSVSDYYATDPDARQHKTIELKWDWDTKDKKDDSANFYKKQRRKLEKTEAAIEREMRKNQTSGVNNEGVYAKDSSVQFAFKNLFFKKNRINAPAPKTQGITKEKIIAASTSGDNFGFFKYSFSITIAKEALDHRNEDNDIVIYLINNLDDVREITTKKEKTDIIVFPNLEVLIEEYNSDFPNNDDIKKFEEFVQKTMRSILKKVQDFIWVSDLDHIFKINIFDNNALVYQRDNLVKDEDI